MIQPAGPMDAMQRLALMMAVMILGAPQVYSCNIGTSLRTPWTTPLSDMEICPVVTFGEETKMRFGEDLPDPDDWTKLPAELCQATQSVLTFLCGPEGRSRAVKFEKFQQPCRVEASACREAAKTGVLKIRSWKMQ